MSPWRGVVMGSGMAIAISPVLMEKASFVLLPTSDLPVISCLSTLVDLELLQLAMATVRV